MGQTSFVSALWFRGCQRNVNNQTRVKTRAFGDIYRTPSAAMFAKRRPVCANWLGFKCSQFPCEKTCLSLDLVLPASTK